MDHHAQAIAAACHFEAAARSLRQAARLPAGDRNAHAHRAAAARNATNGARLLRDLAARTESPDPAGPLPEEAA